MRYKLPSAKDARIYMSVERTYLGYIRFSVYMFSFSIFIKKLETLIFLYKVAEHSSLYDAMAKISALISLVVLTSGLINFHKNVKYIEGGIEVSSKETTDPRIYMAAERTYLAWIRTAIALIVFGFVIEKFEFFLIQLEKLFHTQIGGHHSGLVGIGIFIILIGLLTLVLGMVNFHRTVAKVDKGLYRTHVMLYKLYGAVVFVSCLVLTFYVLRII
ncbi:MAG: DUF202 domain-containing protein [Aquificaceae bacterium]|nr:DUF202 domain-containing protein [Aquificaceae bacterium]